LPHFDGKRFSNPDGRRSLGLPSVIRWKLTSRPERSPNFISDVVPAIPPPSVDGPALRVTIVNHSTVLIQSGGLNILTDPVWSLRASPLSWAGPKRHRAPGIDFENLPPIHLVLLSHNHYDHLDLPTLRRLTEHHRPAIIVPLKVSALLENNGVPRAQEVDWDQSAEVRGAQIHCVPAVHFSARSGADRNKTLWCGYVIESVQGPIYFAGDTAMGNHFSKIRRRFGDPRLALLPIGAYRPRWIMSPVHMDPEEAWRAHHQLCARTSVAIHHGTFQLSDESIDAPARELELLLRRAREKNPFRILRNGDAIDVE
jgi:L-ascorbate metabolism protein UlaG (beta-lactamase superfamily)